MPCAVERDVRRVRFEPRCGRVHLLNVIISKKCDDDDQGDNPGQETEGSTVSSVNCDRC